MNASDIKKTKGEKEMIKVTEYELKAMREYCKNPKMLCDICKIRRLCYLFGEPAQPHEWTDGGIKRKAEYIKKVNKELQYINKGVKL